jgi:hypothetical protein
VTTSAPDQPDTALTLLFGGTSSLDALTKAIGNSDVSVNLDHAIQQLPAPTRSAAARELTAATAGLLDVDVVYLLVSGWRKHHELIAAARSTLKEKGSTELVQLVSHRVTVSRQPRVDIMVDGKRVATIQLSLSLVFDVSAALARVKGGKLTGILTGSCDVTATLAIDGAEAATGNAHFDLPGEVKLRKEVMLLPAGEYPHSKPNAAVAEEIGEGE